MHKNDKLEFFLDSAHRNIELARIHAHLAKTHAELAMLIDENANNLYAMEHDLAYAECLARAMYYLDHARKLRIKEKTK